MSAPATRMPDFSGDGFDLGLLDESARLAFALAVVRPGGHALLIAADHRRARDVHRSGWAPVREAVIGVSSRRLGTARTYAVEPRADMLALDCDGPGADAVRRIAHELGMAGIVPVVIASGKEGHSHLFARVSDLALRHRLAEEARAAGLDVRGGRGRGSAIRPPGAPHHLGLPVVLLHPADPAEALTALATGPSAITGGRRRVVGPTKATRPNFDIPPRASARRRALSPRIAALLRLGDGEGRYESRSEMIQALVTAAVNAGWHESDLWAALCDPSNAAGEKLRGMLGDEGEPEARRWLGASWRRAERFVAQRPPAMDAADLGRRISRLRQEAERFPWPNRSGANDKAVLGAHLDIAEQSGYLTHGASVRQVADMAGVVAGTVSRSHVRLVRMGWLERGARGVRRDRRADEWTVTPPGLPRNSCAHAPPGEETVAGSSRSAKGDRAPKESACGPTTDPTRAPLGGRERNVAGSCGGPPGRPTNPAHDVWRNRGGLGKVGWRTFNALAEPCTVTALAARTGVKRQAAQRQVSKLAAHRLAERLPDGRWIRVGCDFDRVAVELGVAGCGERQHARHLDERKRFDGRLPANPAAGRDAATVPAVGVQADRFSTAGGGWPAAHPNAEPPRRRGRTPEARRVAVRDHMVQRLRVLLSAAEDRLDVQPDDERARAVARRACRGLELWQAAP